MAEHFQGSSVCGSGLDEKTTTSLDMDLRKIDNTVLLGSLVGPLMLQIDSVVDTSRPHCCNLGVDGSSPRLPLLMVNLTDGHATFSALVMGPVSGLTDATLPGTKVLLQHTPAGLNKKSQIDGHDAAVPIKAADLRVLGGRVPKLANAFEKRKRMAAQQLDIRFSGGAASLSQAPSFRPYTSSEDLSNNGRSSMSPGTFQVESKITFSRESSGGKDDSALTPVPAESSKSGPVGKVRPTPKTLKTKEKKENKSKTEKKKKKAKPEIRHSFVMVSRLAFHETSATSLLANGPADDILHSPSTAAAAAAAAAAADGSSETPAKTKIKKKPGDKDRKSSGNGNGGAEPTAEPSTAATAAATQGRGAVALRMFASITPAQSQQQQKQQQEERQPTLVSCGLLNLSHGSASSAVTAAETSAATHRFAGGATVAIAPQLQGYLLSGVDEALLTSASSERWGGESAAVRGLRERVRSLNAAFCCCDGSSTTTNGGEGSGGGGGGGADGETTGAKIFEVTLEVFPEALFRSHGEVASISPPPAPRSLEIASQREKGVKSSANRIGDSAGALDAQLAYHAQIIDIRPLSACDYEEQSEGGASLE